MPRTDTTLLAVAIVASIATAGCFGWFSATYEPAEYQTIRQGFFTGYDAQEFTGLVFNDNASWAAFWEDHQSNQSPKDPVPPVNFSAQFVVAVLMGERPTGGYKINITSVEADGDDYRVHYQETEPCEGCPTSEVITSPVHIVRVDRADGGEPDVDFRRAV